MNEREFDFALALRCGRRRLVLGQTELVGEGARDMALPESMHQTAAAQAASEIKDSDADGTTFATIHAPHWR